MKKYEKGQIKKKCPICDFAPSQKNPLVRYHVSYDPEITILACKYCNFTEFLLRNKIDISKFEFIGEQRTKAVIAYHKKYNIDL